MAYWNWDASYEIGISVIDNQHKRIVEYINELHGAFVSKNKESVSVVLIALADYTVSHFAFEESLMEQAGYLFLEPHKKVHEKFVETVSRYINDFHKGEDISGKLMAELQIWLTHHILHDDKDYKEAVQKLLAEKREIPKEIKKKSWFAKLFG
ncbi:MAG: bacteriohemerythrin [Campylobacteraceae bacterium]|jgi:hemerythrin|nr:bacteriohemerythrin [Campylobacteraceae bacterium]